MAKTKENPKEPEKKSNLKKFFEEYNWENILGLVVGLIAVIIGVYILTGGLRINPSTPLIGTYPNIFALILTGLGAVMLIIVGWPTFEPSMDELKEVTWPTKKKLIGNIFRVFGFIIVLSLIFYFFDAVLLYIYNFLSTIN